MKLRLGLGFSSPVFNRNAAPTDILLSASSIAENNSVNAVVGVLSVTDDGDAGPWTYELVAGTGSTDNASFNISGSNLRASSAFNYEVKSSYAIRLRATDSGGLSFDKQFTVTVTNVNEAPTDIALSASSIAEGNSVNAVIGAFSTTDPDSGNTFTYSLVSGTGSTDNASFNISGANLRATDVFNFESKSSYAIRVRSTDQGGLTFDKQFTITITNANEAPTDIALSNATVPEDLAVGLAIGTLSFTDPDAGATGTFSITVDADNKFDISGTSLIIDHALDYETATSHSVTVRFTDQGGLTYDEAFTVTVTNVDETTTPQLPPTSGTLVYDGGFTVNPTGNKHDGNLRFQGKSGGVAKFVFDIGASVAGHKYTARVDPDFSLLSNTGKEAFVGFGFKEADNDFHFVGQKGDGSTGYHKYKISGSALFNSSSGFTTSDGGAAANGTQAGPNYIQIEIASNGSTYTFRTSSDGSSWTDEYTGSSPSPCANATTATFGIAVFLENSDKGQFSIDVTVWEDFVATDPSFASVVLLLGGNGTNGSTTFTDDSSKGHSPFVTNAVTITTSQKKFGTGSIDCAGVNGGMAYADSADWQLAASNSDQYTIDGWIRADAFEDGDTVFGVHDGQNNHYSWNLQLSGTDKIKFQTTPDGTFASSVVTGPTSLSMSTGTWYFFAISKNASGKVRIHVGASGTASMVASATPANSAMFDATTAFSIGSPSGAGTLSNQYDGQLDELRITKGVCRYDTDSAIPVPTAAFPRSA